MTQKFAYFRLSSIETSVCLFFFLKNNINSLENLQKLDYIITGIEWDLNILKKKKIEFYVFATILDSILDFSARHQ